MAESSKVNFLCFIHHRPTPPSAAISLPEEKNLPAAGKKPASQEKTGPSLPIAEGDNQSENPAMTGAKRLNGAGPAAGKIKLIHNS